ncbi:hypothetical protein B0T10DRAFT_172445 [Thelonectria olida]|uniref:Uncharacterized protein n=1 Tax=Thelonectria olida TaxID=1576542 RepID=A0A9P8WGH7_9HYPO|nr:hypothetical protein B0T10DRAFT_172445 [Thelonectria olida]
MFRTAESPEQKRREGGGTGWRARGRPRNHDSQQRHPSFVHLYICSLGLFLSSLKLPNFFLRKSTHHPLPYSLPLSLTPALVITVMFPSSSGMCP